MRGFITLILEEDPDIMIGTSLKTAVGIISLLGLFITTHCAPSPFTSFFIDIQPFLYFNRKTIKNHPPWKYSDTKQPDTSIIPTQCTYIHGTSRNNTMGVGWAMIQNSGSKGLTNEVPVVRLSHFLSDTFSCCCFW